jgi:hypothetical protein
MRGAIPPLPQYTFMAWCLVKHRDSFIFFTVLKMLGLTQNTLIVVLIVQKVTKFLFKTIKAGDFK